MIGLADVDRFKIFIQLCVWLDFPPLYLITSFKQISYVLIFQHKSGKILRILMQLISGNIEVV